MSRILSRCKRTLGLLAIIPLLIIGCTEDIIEKGNNALKNNIVTLTAVIDTNGPATRSSLVREDSQLKTYWTENDKIWIYCEKISDGSRELIPVDNNPVQMNPNPNNPTTGSMSFTIPSTLKGSPFKIVGCSDSYYSHDNKPQLTEDGNIIFNIDKSEFHRTDQEDVRIPMFFHQTISAEGTVSGPTKFKNMGSLILLSLTNTTSSTLTGKFNWTTTANDNNQYFYYTNRGFKTGCYDGAGDIIDGHFSENAIIEIDDTNSTSAPPTSYSIPSKETIELAAWFAPVKDSKIVDLTVNFVLEEGGTRSGKVTLTPEITPRIGKAYAFYGNITGWNLKINKEKYLDVTGSDGTFVVCEGNMTTTNGMLVYYDKNGTEYINAFKHANNGLEIGNVVQDMYMANGKVYLLTQNGDNMGGAGRFVVCDARTMKMEYANPLIIKTPEGKATWPQHLVVTSDKRAYVQYSEVMEATSGIVELELGEKEVAVKNTVEGTFGSFTVNGTTKARMVYSRGKVFAGNGHHVVIIDPEKSVVEKKLTFPGQQVKGIVKAADGNIYFALAGKFEGNQNGWGAINFTSPAQIVGINHQGETILTQDCPDEIKFSVATWSPSINMGASFTDPHLYFTDSSDFSVTTASRYNYVTKTFDVNYIKFDDWDSIYGIMGVHPTTKKLWVTRSTNGYTTGDVYIYNVSSSAELEKNFQYPTQMGASPAGVDFAYRFTKEWINK